MLQESKRQPHLFVVGIVPSPPIHRVLIVTHIPIKSQPTTWSLQHGAQKKDRLQIDMEPNMI